VHEPNMIHSKTQSDRAADRGIYQAHCKHFERKRGESPVDYEAECAVLVGKGQGTKLVPKDERRERVKNHYTQNSADGDVN